MTRPVYWTLFAISASLHLSCDGPPQPADHETFVDININPKKVNPKTSDPELDKSRNVNGKYGVRTNVKDEVIRNRRVEYRFRVGTNLLGAPRDAIILKEQGLGTAATGGEWRTLNDLNTELTLAFGTEPVNIAPAIVYRAFAKCFGMAFNSTTGAPTPDSPFSTTTANDGLGDMAEFFVKS